MPIGDESTQLSATALERILEVTRSLARPSDTTTMLENIIDASRTVLEAERGTVFLYDAKNKELVARVATGQVEMRVPDDKGIVGKCAQTRRVINVPDCYADPRFNQDIDRETGYRTRCLMTVPLIGHDDSLEGVLQVLNKRDGVFTETDERVATALAAQCAVALQRTRLLKDLVSKERMERELLVARQIQMRVLPQVMPQIEGCDVFGWCRPADQTGGDIFDLLTKLVVDKRGRVALAIDLRRDIAVGIIADGLAHGALAVCFGCQTVEAVIGAGDDVGHR